MEEGRSLIVSSLPEELQDEIRNLLEKCYMEFFDNYVLVWSNVSEDDFGFKAYYSDFSGVEYHWKDSFNGEYKDVGSNYSYSEILFDPLFSTSKKEEIVINNLFKIVVDPLGFTIKDNKIIFV